MWNSAVKIGFYKLIDRMIIEMATSNVCVRLNNRKKKLNKKLKKRSKMPGIFYINPFTAKLGFPPQKIYLVKFECCAKFLRKRKFMR